jgi:hypothetical protein
MNQVGSPTEWIDLVDSQVPVILALVIEAWEAMPLPAGDELEDTVTEVLCRFLRTSRSSRNLPLRIDTQLVELDPAAGQDQGRMDIVFSPMVPREDIYFCLECKRINVRGEAAVRPYFVEYVRFGMLRFVRGQYANSVRFGGMLAFVLNGDIAGAIAGVDDNIRRLHGDLLMDDPHSFSASTVLPDEPRARETKHRRGYNSKPFVIHHLFMPGDPNAPLRPIVALNPKKSRRTRRSVKRTPRA